MLIVCGLCKFIVPPFLSNAATDSLRALNARNIAAQVVTPRHAQRADGGTPWETAIT
jgi:hypothetical protein